MESNKTIRIFDGAIAIVTGGASGIRLSPSLGIFLAQKRFQKMQKELEIIHKR